MNSVNRMTHVMHTMTDRELFDLQTTATGTPPPNIELNLQCLNPPVVYNCAPTHIVGVRVYLYPNDTEAQNAVGNVVLELNVTHGTISFPVNDGKL
jgi:hypothetical protein